jgi:hypothetical protein
MAPVSLFFTEKRVLYKTFGRAPSEELKPGPYQTYPKREGEHVDGALETNMWDGWSSFGLVLGPENKI